MELNDKARIRMEHWIAHNDHHLEEYQDFADELEAAGQVDSAMHVREMIELTRKSNECLRLAIEKL